MNPTRCIIVDVDGDEIFPGIIAKTPKISKPHIGKHGLAEEDDNLNVKITLDDGTVIMGYECWWQPEKEMPCHTN